MRALLRALATLALAGAATAAALLGAELAARTFAPSWAPQHAERNFWRHDALLGWEHVPGREGVMHHPDFRVHVAISAQGFRDRVYPLERVPGRRRMLVLGDSFAWGFGVEREEGLFERIEARHPEWEVINTAVSGYGTDQQLLFLDQRGAAFAPDAVVLLLHPNDVEDVAADRRYGYPKPVYRLEGGALVLHNVPVPQLSWPWRLRKWLLQTSYLFHRLQAVEALLEEREARGRPALRAAGWLPGVAGAPAGDAPGPARGAAGPADGAPDLRLTAALLARLAERSREAGARLLVASVPGPDALADGLARSLAPLGVPYRPLDAAFRGRPRETWGFPNDPHWNATGHAIAADAVEEFLTDAGLLPWEELPTDAGLLPGEELLTDAGLLP